MNNVAINYTQDINIKFTKNNSNCEIQICYFFVLQKEEDKKKETEVEKFLIFKENLEKYFFLFFFSTFKRNYIKQQHTYEI